MTPSPRVDSLLSALERVRVLALAVVDDQGVVSRANKGLAILASGLDPGATEPPPLRLVRPDPATLLRLTSAGGSDPEVYRGPITLRGQEGDEVSLVGRLHTLDQGLLLVGEPPGRTGEAVAERLATLHRELAEVTRRLKDELRERDHLAAQRARDQEWLATLEREAEVQRFGQDVLNLIGHHLDTPVTPIRVGLHTLKDQDLDEQGRAVLERLERNVARLEATMSELRTAVEVAQGLAGPNREMLTVASLIDQVVEHLDQEAQARGVTVETDLAPDLQVRGDPALMRRALDLLIDNAIHQTPPGGRVTVSSGRGEGAVLVRVTDGGPGLPEELGTWVFKPFGRVRGEAVQTEAGPGIQLYTVRGIARAHGGSLSQEASDEGRGATFVLSLPGNPRSS